MTGEAHTRRGLIVADLVERRIRQDLVGSDPLLLELLWHRLWELGRIEKFPIYALGLVDVGLWDLACKAAELPVQPGSGVGGGRRHLAPGTDAGLQRGLGPPTAL
ncbi:hypothetical protein [Streptomyces sp. NPDC002520]